MEEGWLFKVKLSNPEEVDELMNQDAYEKYLKELVFYSHSLEIGNYLLKTIDFENNLFNLFN